MQTYILVAQQTPAGGAAPSPDGGAGRPAGGFDPTMLLMFGVILFWFWLVVMRPAKKQEAERKARLTSLKRNDEVVTTGGIIGTVVGIKEKAGGVVGEED